MIEATIDIAVRISHYPPNSRRRSFNASARDRTVRASARAGPKDINNGQGRLQTGSPFDVEGAPLATKDQYDVYKAAYDEENARYDTLNDRMKTYLSVITLYSGLLIFKASDLPATGKNDNGAILFGSGSLAFVAALITFLVAGRVRPYKVAFSPADYIAGLRDDVVVQDEMFYDTRVGEIAAAIEQNSVQTDGIARGMFVGSIFLIVGIAFNLLYVATLLLVR